ncbi:hypothetical protein D3C85_924860 [compost metagenome]
MSRRQVDQKRRDGEWRQTPWTTAVRGAHRIGNRAETAHARTDDGGRALLGLSALRLPSRLLQCLTCRFHRKQDETVHLLLFFWWRRQIRVEPGLSIIRRARHCTTDLGR